MSLASLLDRAAAGGRLSFDEGVRLYNEADIHELGAAAHARRMAMHPRDVVTYVVDTTINYTNVCNVHCTFCAFFRPEHHKEGYTMSHDVVLERVKYAADQGATQIMIQGGVNPELGIEWFETLFDRVRREYPHVDIHSLSVSEIVGLAHVEGISTRDVLSRLKEAGMKSLPGAGAEILVERVRKRISARKVKPHEWLGVMREAQQLGMPTTATMMFGSIETHEERIEHMHVLRELQDETGGFTAFIPVVLRTVQDAAARKRINRPRVLARARDLAALSRQLRASASFVAHAGVEDGPARALLRLRRYGRNDPRRARRPRCRKHQRSHARRTGKPDRVSRLQTRRARHVLEPGSSAGSRNSVILNAVFCHPELVEG